jgi:hypothetical protein
MARPADVLRSDVDTCVACIAPTVAALLYPVALLARGGGTGKADGRSMERQCLQQNPANEF